MPTRPDAVAPDSTQPRTAGPPLAAAAAARAGAGSRARAAAQGSPAPSISATGNRATSTRTDCERPSTRATTTRATSTRRGSRRYPATASTTSLTEFSNPTGPWRVWRPRGPLPRVSAPLTARPRRLGRLAFRYAAVNEERPGGEAGPFAGKRVSVCGELPVGPGGAPSVL